MPFTKPYRFLTVRVYFVIRDGSGKEVGRMTTLTGVEGDSSLWNYGKAKIECEYLSGPCIWDTNGTDTVTVRDRVL